MQNFCTKITQEECILYSNSSFYYIYNQKSLHNFYSSFYKLKPLSFFLCVKGKMSHFQKSLLRVEVVTKTFTLTYLKQ